MDTLQVAAPAVKPGERDLERVYRLVNEAWGRPRRELPKLTAQEAVTAYRMLIRFALKKTAKPKSITITSGNRLNFITTVGGDCYINPDRGWWSLVHAIAHYVHWKTAPAGRRRPHDPLEAYTERRLIEHVVKSGWLDGKLKRPEREKKPKADSKQVRVDSAKARLKAWESKRKRAETAIRKLKRTLAYYEKKNIA